MTYFVVVAREEYKEEEVLLYQGDYSPEELKQMATEEVRKNTTMEYDDIEDCYVHNLKRNNLLINDKYDDQHLRFYF